MTLPSSAAGHGLRPYPAYRDSGVEWLGPIPDTWDSRRLKGVAAITAGQSPPSTAVDSQVQGLPFLQGNREFGALHPEPKFSCDVARARAKQDDILFSVRAPVGAINVADRPYGIGRGLCAITTGSGIDQRFLRHSMLAMRESMDAVATGSTYDAVSVGDVGNCVLPIPSTAEQVAVADYLDAVTSKIRSYVRARERLIELLEEYKQALIQQAVTGQIDVRTGRPYPSYKDSIVVGHGEIPTHWTTLKLRHILRRLSLRNRPDSPLLSVVRRKGVILRNVSDAETNRNVIPEDLSNYQAVRVGQFAMNKMKAWQGSYGVSSYTGIVSPAYFVFEIKGVSPDYLHVALRSRAYVPLFCRISDGVRIGQWDLAETRMREIAYLVPPRREQNGIARYVNRVDARIRRYVRVKKRQIALAEELRTRLISDVVTGKLDVRGVAPLPESEAGIEAMVEEESA